MAEPPLFGSNGESRTRNTRPWTPRTVCSWYTNIHFTPVGMEATWVSLLRDPTDGFPILCFQPTKRGTRASKGEPYMTDFSVHVPAPPVSWGSIRLYTWAGLLDLTLGGLPDFVAFWVSRFPSFSPTSERSTTFRSVWKVCGSHPPCSDRAMSGFLWVSVRPPPQITDLPRNLGGSQLSGSLAF